MPLPPDLRVADVEPLWEDQLDATRAETLHEPTIQDDCVRLVLTTKTAVFGLTILPVPSNQPGSLVKLCDIPQRTPASAIPAHSLCYSALQSPPNIILIHHPWPDEDGNPQGAPTVVKKKLPYWGKVCPIVDIQTGRVITGTNPIGVVELSPPPLP